MIALAIIFNVWCHFDSYRYQKAGPCRFKVITVLPTEIYERIDHFKRLHLFLNILNFRP